MSKEVKRFTIGTFHAAIVSAGSECVLASDYDALLAERDALKQLLAETRTSMIEAIHWEDLTPVRKRIETAMQGEQP
ncbi:hypothetical protein [Stutzerimonas nitrititolerans]|uniref:hypothetical protein n=1 Tax=Stutzerimonas nitrititolerans TaxID=2482751 RepID=UPI0028A74D05|nr:hypothetical protein [Stutzerimonas nitrititolerans]